MVEINAILLQFPPSVAILDSEPNGSHQGTSEITIVVGWLTGGLLAGCLVG